MLNNMQIPPEPDQSLHPPVHMDINSKLPGFVVALFIGRGFNVVYFRLTLLVIYSTGLDVCLAHCNYFGT